MGGNAFNVLLPNASFPRMPPQVYLDLKAKLTPTLQTLYSIVAIPPEAPEKPDHGDLDVVVCGPCDGLVHEDVRRALKSTCSIPLEGNRTSNFAIPVESLELEWPTPSKEAYVQVDVRVCANAQDWERAVLFSSYGDTGMMLGLLARSMHLSMGSSGLRLANPVPTSPPTTFYLSYSFPSIFAFLGLPMDRWEQGFQTQREVFDWIASSPYYVAKRLVSSNKDQTGNKKARDARGMYQSFLEFNRSQNAFTPSSRSVVTGEAAMNMALVYFGRRQLYDALLHTSSVKKHAKAVFTGRSVEEWTEMKGMPIRLIMEEVRRRLGGTDILPAECAISIDGEADDRISPALLIMTVWEKVLFTMSSGEIRTLTTTVKEEMDKEGKLAFDWRKAKRQKEEQNALQRQNERTAVEND